jgi:hypothetical protein
MTHAIKGFELNPGLNEFLLPGTETRGASIIYISVSFEKAMSLL